MQDGSLGQFSSFFFFFKAKAEILFLGESHYIFLNQFNVSM
jgi:hypothetical protein